MAARSIDVSELVPATEAAAALRMTRERLVRAIQAGKLPGEMREGRWFVPRSALQASAEMVRRERP